VEAYPTGLAIALPPGYEAQVRPRSGLALKQGVSVLNTPGTIDADYRGEVGVILVNHNKADLIVKRGDRIAQMVIKEVVRIEFEEVEDLVETDRGAGGFGHTGFKMIKVIVNGAKGKMGQATVAAVSACSDLKLVAQTDVGDDLAGSIKSTKAEIVVDFTQPDAALKNVKTIITSGAHAVIGTTGLKENDLKEIEKLCEKNKVNCLIAPNFAIGAVLMMLFAREAAKYLHKAEIIELHHDKKLDKPSGTALKTAQLMKESLGPGVEVPIHSVRLPGLVAHQEVIFGGLGQTLSIRHDSISRESFMPGVIWLSARYRGSKGWFTGSRKYYK